MPRPADTFSSAYDLATLQETMDRGWRHVAALANGLRVFGGLGEEWLGWRQSSRPKKTLCRVAEHLFGGAAGWQLAYLFRDIAMEDGHAGEYDQWWDNAGSIPFLVEIPIGSV